MSYILEALKKVEQRGEEEARPPRSIKFSEEERRELKRRPLWPYALVGAMLVNAAVITWWIIPWRSARQEAAVPSSGAHQAVLEEPAVPARVPRAGPAETKEVPPQVQVASRNPERTAGHSVRDVAPAAARKPTGADYAALERPGRPERPVAPQRVLELNELPAAVRSGLPDFKVSGHAFTPESRGRVVRVNEKILQEGQDLSPRVKLEEITPDGMVFRSDGYRFRVKVNVQP